MTIDEFVDEMQGDLVNEYTHMLFYMHASFTLNGYERMFAVPWLTAQSNEEMGHVRQFAEKIRAFGKMPTHANGKGYQGGEYSFTTLKEILEFALALEKTVIENYHKRLGQAQKLFEKTGKYYDLVIFYEEHIEHSQHDVDEIVKMLSSTR
jgi:bacterioferritin (cytochrome b1)